MVLQCNNDLVLRYSSVCAEVFLCQKVFLWLWIYECYILTEPYYVEVLADLKKVSKLLMVKKETVKKYIRAALSDRQELDIW